MCVSEDDKQNAIVAHDDYETENKIPVSAEESVAIVHNDPLYPKLPNTKDIIDRPVATDAASQGAPATVCENIPLQKAPYTKEPEPETLQTQISSLKGKADVQNTQIAPQPILKVVPPTFAHRLPGVPIESDYLPSEERYAFCSIRSNVSLIFAY